MGLEQRVGTLYRHANESFGRPGAPWTLLQLGFALVSMGALVAFLATTVDWYWHALGWLGVLYAVLLSWILLGSGLITYRDLLHPSWLPRSRRPIPRSMPENHVSTPEPRLELEQIIKALGNDFSAFCNEVNPKIAALENSVVPVVRAHARMIMLVMDRDTFSGTVAEFEKLSQAIRGGFLGRDPADTSERDLAFGAARIAIAKLIKDDFGEDVDLWPDLKAGEAPPAAAPDDDAIADPARQRDYRDFHRRHGVASRRIQEFKGRYNSEMERTAEIVSAYGRGIARYSEP